MASDSAPGKSWHLQRIQGVSIIIIIDRFGLWYMGMVRFEVICPKEISVGTPIAELIYGPKARSELSVFRPTMKEDSHSLCAQKLAGSKTIPSPVLLSIMPAFPYHKSP